MRIAITGHRPNKLWNDYDLVSPGMQAIKMTLKRAIDKFNPTVIISGMALGIDMMWAELAIEHQLPLLACIPCLNQESKWPEKSQMRYRKILDYNQCTEVHVTKGSYTQACMQKRNEYMVEHCNLLLAVWDGTSGGTANCVYYARSVERKGWIINPNTLKIEAL